jgi:hypothetical protein
VSERASVSPDTRVDRRLLVALAGALGILHAQELRRARALQDLGAIDLPGASPSGGDPALLESLGPLYLAHELERCGLLRTAELIAGLFASGAITQPLGPTAQLIGDFWRARNERLNPQERQFLLEQTFSDAGFYPLMQQLCSALTALADNRDASDIRESVQLSQAGVLLVDALGRSAGGMLGLAAREVIEAINAATRFLRDRMLQAAFGVRDLWELVSVAGGATGVSPTEIRQRVELGASGVRVLSWLTQAYTATGDVALNPVAPGAAEVMTAAQRWLMAHAGLARLRASAAPDARGAASAVAALPA